MDAHRGKHPRADGGSGVGVVFHPSPLPSLGAFRRVGVLPYPLGHVFVFGDGLKREIAIQGLRQVKGMAILLLSRRFAPRVQEPGKRRAANSAGLTIFVPLNSGKGKCFLLPVTK